MEMIRIVKGVKTAKVIKTGKMKRWLAVLLTICMCIGLLSGCLGPSGNQGAGNGHPEETKDRSETADQNTGHEEDSTEADQTVQMNKEAVYEIAALDVELPISHAEDMVSNGQMIYVWGMNISKAEDGSGDTYRKYQFVGCDLSGNMICTIPMYTEIETLGGRISYDTGYKVQIDGMAVTPDGKLVIVIAGTATNMDHYQVVMFDEQGSELWRQELEQECIWPVEPVCGEKQVFVYCGNTVFVYDYAGSLQKEFVLDTLPEEIEVTELNPDIRELYFQEDGQSYVVFWNVHGTKRVVIEIDLETGELGTSHTIPGPAINELVDGTGSGYEFLVRDSLSVYSWNFMDEEKTELLNFLDSSLEEEAITRLVSVAEGKLLAICSDVEGKETVCVLNKVAPQNVKEKQLITLGVLSTSISGVTKDIVRFNQVSDGYFVKLVDYSQYPEPVTQLNLDIAAGHVPDVFYIDWYSNEEVPLADYGRQGVLEDLKLWFDGDTGLDRDAYLTNVFDAYGLDGKWYQLPTQFAVATYVGKTSVVGSGEGWTMEDLRKLEAEYPDSEALVVPRETLLRDALIMRWEQFADEAEGTCSFDSEGFVELLNWAAEIPEESGVHGPMDFRNEEVLLNRLTFGSFSDFNIKLDKLFHTETTFIGFPDTEKTGGLIEETGVVLAMSARCEEKEAAWEFIRYYLTDEYQVDKLSTVSGLFPVKISSLEVMAEKAMNPMWGMEDYYYLNGKEVAVAPPTQETVDRWIKYMRSIEYADTLDNEIYNIIIEETGALFAGQKSAEAVADIIQNRVGIYLAELQ